MTWCFWAQDWHHYYVMKPITIPSVSVILGVAGIDMMMPTRSTVHYLRPFCPKRLDTSPIYKQYILNHINLKIIQQYTFNLLKPVALKTS